ncbi:MAG: hypothetical protein ACXADY_13910 [Candidatus Hodarchaeales archaeon]|jgi:hypothetical protein
MRDFNESLKRLSNLQVIQCDSCNELFTREQIKNNVCYVCLSKILHAHDLYLQAGVGYILMCLEFISSDDLMVLRARIDTLLEN